MSNIQSYNALIDRFKAFASGHFILKRFSHGQIEVSDLEKFGEYPFMHVVPSNVTYAKGMKTFSFQIVLADMPRDKEDKTEYQREVLSDLQRIAEDLVAEITNHRVLFGDLITVNNVSLEPFLEEFQHTLTGWTISLDLLVPYYWDACSIPAEWNDMFESSTGGTGSILTFIDSITRDENGNVSLVNDEAEPSPNYYYGTDDEGVRGWYLLETGGGLTCETIGDCQTIIDIEAAIDALEEEILLKADITSISAVGFSNDYNDLDNKPTIPNAQVNSDWNATSGVAEILNKPTIPTATSDLTNDGEDGVNPFITAQDLPDTSGFVPYTGATQNVDLGTHTLSAKDLVINHSSGSGVAASITKGGAGEALTVNKTSGSGNAMSVTGGVTQLSELHLTTDLADAYIASAATWNAKVPSTRTLTINGTTQDLSANRTFTIATGLTVGTTPITSGTIGRVLFEGTGNVLQQSGSLFWDNTNSRLGVGTATPLRSLDVRGIARIENGGSCEFDIIGQTNNFRIGVSSSQALFGTLNAFALAFFTNASERARIFATTGNFAIGTTTDAGFKLDVNGTARVSGDTIIQGSSVLSAANAFLVRNASAVHAFSAANNCDLYFGKNKVFSYIDSSTGGYNFTLTASNSGISFSNNAGASRPVSFSMNTGEILRIHQSYTAIVTNSFLVGTTTDIASSKLTVESTTQGFLPPRMTTTQKNAIASPASGLVVYDTTLGKLCVRGASTWETITSI
jgi:hypothetical protein